VCVRDYKMKFDLEKKHWVGVLLRSIGVFVYNLLLIAMGNISFLHVALLRVGIPSRGRHHVHQ